MRTRMMLFLSSILGSISLVLAVSSWPWRGPLPAVLSSRRLLSSQRSATAVADTIHHHYLHSQSELLPSYCRIRGGGLGDDSDEERYSRQVYTLGARAHGLVRAATIYLDGPPESGLMYECAKNLALSGVGHIVLLTTSSDDDEETLDSRYHNSNLDDLGQAYGRAARAELGHDGNGVGSTHLMMEYIKRLNPSVNVSIQKRSELHHVSSRGVLLAVDRPLSTQIVLNDICRSHQLAFVAVETAGVYGRTFCDFGPSFQVVDADGENPLVVPLDRVEPSDDQGDNKNDDAIVWVHVVEGEKHDVSKGDHIQFHSSSGEALSPSCQVVRVETPRRFTIRLSDISVTEFVANVNQHARSFRRVKRPEDVQFLSLREAIGQAESNDALFTPCDLDKSFDPIRRSALFSCFGGLDSFVKQHNRLPGKQDSKLFRSIARRGVEEALAEKKGWRSIVKSFSQSCAAKLTPIQAILGAIGAQEVLKAATGLYTPIKQFLLYDCDELLLQPNKSAAGDSLDETSGQSYVLGKALCETLANKRLFIVGAGAIGCELLKNLSAMGVATKGNGSMIVTDMDTIEKSNLSRQLLFRDADIGKFKSTAAHDAVLRFNPSIRMEVHTSKVGDEAHGPFRDDFWSKRVDIVLNALDNMEARLYIDGQCVTNQKALVDAGTQGPKGNVQVVIPHQSESYGSSVDPPDPAIPLCTLKNFPYSISHTIQWGRDLFEGYFQRRPNQANDHAATLASKDPSEFWSKLLKDLGEVEAQKTADELDEDWNMNKLVQTEELEKIRDAALQWAVASAFDSFHDSILDLLRQHPIDSVDEDGELFWSGTRRVPSALKFDESNTVDSRQINVNENLVCYVKTAARLRMETFVPANDSRCTFSNEEAIVALRNGSQRIPLSSETQEGRHSRIESFPSAADTCRSHPLRIAEFEKDDESNDHVSFVTAASNLRALSYGIAPVDAMETRRVAGRIVAAMISTTAFVSALSCVELLKLVQNAPLRNHRNAFINLALPFFAYTAPLPAEISEGLQGTTYTIWDKIVVREKGTTSPRGMSLRKFLRRVLQKAGHDPDLTSVSSISYGPYMIYASFLHEDDEEILGRPILELVREAIQQGDDDDFAARDDDQNGSPDVAGQIEILEGSKTIDLTVVVEDRESGEEAELPPVRLERQPPVATTR